MQTIQELQTPNFIVDLDIMERNIQCMGEKVREHGKQLCPMVKTHKCTEICRMQQQLGQAESFMAGTITEAEKMAQAGIQNIVMAYPQAGKVNLARIAVLLRRINLCLCFDGVEAAALTAHMLYEEGLEADYVIIVDCGLHRLGVQPEDVVDLAVQLQAYSNLHLQGISSHPGHVYGAVSQEEVAAIVVQEEACLRQAKEELMKRGFPVSVVATGSTPTTAYEVKSDVITCVRPGNYVFNDALQVALGAADEKDCSLTVLATVIAHPQPEYLIIDAGTKCFGLDRGAHNISLIQGFGIVKDHPELLVESLSEEVGKLRVTSSTMLRVGDMVQVIPNHACVVANMTEYLTGVRHGIVERRLHVDARGGV